MSLIEVILCTDKLKLYNELDVENRDDTLPVRHTLWYLMIGKINEGRVYVDRWPTFSCVCCLYSTKLYSPTSDRDFVVVSSNDKKKFPNFVSDLLSERQWRRRQGVVFAYIEESLADIVKGILHPRNDDDQLGGSFFESKPLRHYTTGVEPNNYDYFEQLRAKYFPQLPPNLSITTMRPNESRLIIENWPYELPDKTEMFEWLIRNFPSVCIRDSSNNDRPLAWVSSYSFGATGGAFVLPEYRSRGLFEVFCLTILIELLKINPAPRYFWIIDGNTASIRSSRRTITDLRATDLMVKLITYTSPQKKVQSRL